MNFTIIEKQYNEVPKLFYGYIIALKSETSDYLYFDEYIRMISGVGHEEYFNKAVECGGNTIKGSIIGKQALFPDRRAAGKFLDWVESMIVLNKLTN